MSKTSTGNSEFEEDFIFFENLVKKHNLQGDSIFLPPFIAYFGKEMGYFKGLFLAPQFIDDLWDFSAQSKVHSRATYWIEPSLSRVGGRNRGAHLPGGSILSDLLYDCGEFWESRSWEYLNKFFPKLLQRLLLSKRRPSELYAPLEVSDLMIRAAHVTPNDWVSSFIPSNPGFASLLPQARPISGKEIEVLFCGNVDLEANAIARGWYDEKYRQGETPIVTSAFLDYYSLGLSSLFNLLSGRSPESDTLDPWSLEEFDSRDYSEYDSLQLGKHHILACPCLSGEGRGYEKEVTGAHWLKWIAASLKPGCFGSVLVNDTSLTCQGTGPPSPKKWIRKWRKHLVDNGSIEAVVGLPSRIIHGSSMYVSMMILRSKKVAPGPSPIKFVDASDCLLKSTGTNKPRLDVEAVIARLNQENGKGVVSVDPDAIQRLDYDLSPTLYIYDSEVCASDDEIVYRLKDLLSAPTKAKGNLGAKGIPIEPLHLTEKNTSFPDTKPVTFDEVLHPNRLRSIAEDCILVDRQVSKQGLRATFFSYQGTNLFVPTSIFVFRVNESLVDPSWLALALDSKSICKQVTARVLGSTIPSLTKDRLLSVRIAVPKDLKTQRALAEAHKEQIAEAKVREIGANRDIQEIRNAFIEDLRLKKHSLSQVTNNIKSSINTLQSVLIKQGQITAEDLISPSRSLPFKTYLQHVQQDCMKLGKMIENLTSTAELGPLEPLNLEEILARFKEENRSRDFTINVDFDRDSFEDSRTGKIIKPVIQIAKADFHTVCQNIIENARRHGFRETTVDPMIEIYVTFCIEDQCFEIHFQNNGKPMPEGMDTGRFILRGERAGASGNTGLGGFHIKSIMDHAGGIIEVENRPEHPLPVNIILRFPISHENS